MRGLLAHDRSWVEERYNRIFGQDAPTENQKLFLALQLSVFNAHEVAYGFIKPALERALENGIDRYPATWGHSRLECFAEYFGLWLYQLYAMGAIGLDDEMLKEWESKASSVTVGNVLGEVCESIRWGSGVTEEVVHRVQLLWDDLAKRADACSETLCGSFSLAASHLFPSDWLRKALLEEARSRNAVLEFTTFFDDVLSLAKEDPEWGIILLRTILEHDEEREFYNYSDTSRSLIDLHRDMGGSERDDDLRFCMDALGRLGILDLE